MNKLTERTLTVLLILASVATHSWELSVCHLHSCFCADLYHNVSSTERHDPDDVTHSVSRTERHDPDDLTHSVSRTERHDPNDVTRSVSRTERHDPDDLTHSVSSTDHHDTYDVTCFVKSFNPSDQTMQRLTSEVRSLKLFCSDSYKQNHLTSTTFRQLSNLLKLSLENCHFSTVSSHAFDSVPQLQVLEIKNCLITELPGTIFNRTVNLSRLTLTQCGLQTLPQLCSLQNLQHLNVSGQGVSSLDACVEECSFDMLFNNLTTVDISNNSFVSLPQTFLSKAPNLRELHLQNNQVSEISLRGNAKLEIFDGLGQEVRKAKLIGDDCVSQLKVLKLESNGSMLFPSGDLECMPNLTFLHLQNFAMTDSFWEILPFLKNLQYLALPVNRLTSINLTAEVSLTHLNLSRNAIREVKRSTFFFHKDLVGIDLSWNNVTKVTSGCFVNMTSLQYLNLQHNQLVMILQSGLLHLPSLQELLLGYNQVRSLPVYLLRQMRALKYLILDHNKLMFLPSLVDAEELVEVRAEYNQITSLSTGQFSGLTNLEFLFLRGNSLTSLNPAVFRKVPILKFLDLSENKIQRVLSFGNHPGLKWIRLDSNNIQHVTFVFRDLPGLMLLFLDNNTLSRVTSETFPPSLQFLSLTWNQLTYVEPYVFVSLSSLKVVNLGTNPNLYSLPQASVQISPNHLPKPAFTVAPNVFDCDCNLAYLKAWDLTTQAGDSASSSDLLAVLPDFFNLHVLDCVTHFTGTSYVKFKDLPLSYFVCPFKETLCDDTCTCCRAQSPAHDPNCTCILTCPETCTCFHGGSEYIHLYTHVFCEKRNLTDIPEQIPARATHVRLDGNSLTLLRNTTLTHASSVMFLYLNNSLVEVLEPWCFKGLDVLQVLDLSHNNIIRIGESTFGSLPALEELDLQSNQIQFLDQTAFSKLTALKILYLNGNLLTKVDSFSVFSSSALITLAYNPWSCDCKFVDSFLKFLIAQRENVLDYFSLRCFFDDDSSSFVSENLLKSNATQKENATTFTGRDSHNQSSILMSEFQLSQFCNKNGSTIHHDSVHQAGGVSHGTLVAIICIVVMVVVAVAVGVAGVMGRAVIQAVLYIKFGIRLWDDASKLDREEDTAALDKNAVKGNAAAAGDLNAPRYHRLYDAFVSYSHHDEDFVVNTLVPRLEQQGPRQYRLCVHYRDFPVGHSIADTIMDSVEASQRTILLLSRHFLQSDWCRFEFRTAHHHVLLEGGHRLIIILLEELSEDLLDGDLKVAMKTRTYLSAKDPWFWEKLYFAMPDLPCCHHDDQLQEPQPTTHTEEVRPVASPDDVEVGGHPLASQANQMMESLEMVILKEEIPKLPSL